MWLNQLAHGTHDQESEKSIETVRNDRQKLKDKDIKQLS